MTATASLETSSVDHVRADDRRAYVVVATKGRPTDIPILLERLAKQTLRPHRVVVVGTELADFGDAPETIAADATIEFRMSERAGTSVQRNVGIDALLEHHDAGHAESDFFIAYFDDDFRPADDWLECAAAALAETGVVGVTGHVLADGKRSLGVSEEAARDYIDGRRPPEVEVAESDRSVISAYGCNMAFDGSVSRSCKFDERLPAYAWQEDRDYTGQALNLGVGEVRSVSACRGVHLAVARGRVSGLRFGYSQIANPIYIARKGTTPWRAMLRLMAANVAANHVRSLRRNADIDWRGRAQGNWIAARDLVTGRLDPERIAELTR